MHLNRKLGDGEALQDAGAGRGWERREKRESKMRKLLRAGRRLQIAGRKSKFPPKVPIVIQDDSLPTGPFPQIRILKRSTSSAVFRSPNSTSRPALPSSCKQILGSASTDKQQEKPILNRPTRISQPENSRQPNNVIRQPSGPDGSQGFKQRR
uniref:SUZ-C domain-containing protein n=1 Tax=Sus scrofa TaxID=9823 RepID=A0A8W4FIN9_PIG